MKSLIFGLVLLLAAADSYAQITITSDDYLNSYGTGGHNGSVYSSQTSTGLSAFIQTSAPGSTWDFSSISFPDSSGYSSQLVAYPGGAALADDPDFSTATHVSISSDNTTGATTYTFLRLLPEGEWVLGITEMKDGQATKLGTYEPPYLGVKLPMTYQTTWQSKSSFILPSLPAGATDSISVDGNVDSYGTIVLPGGRSESALRVKLQNSTSIGFPGVPTQVTTNLIYEWVTSSGTAVTILTDKNGAPTSIQYSVPSGANAGVAEQQNAADRALQVLSGNGMSIVAYSLANSMPVRLTVSDVTGRVVETLADGPASAGQHTSQISTSTLPDGMYFVHLYGNGVSATQKMMVQR